MAYLKLDGEVGYDITLYSVVAAIQDLRKKETITELNIDITSYGGDSEEGRDIYSMLKNLEFPVNTNGVDFVCSSALTIFCAGEKRTSKDNTTEWLMHSPKFAPTFFDAMFGLSEDELDYLKKSVADEKQLLAKIYSESFNIDIDTIKTLMDKDEMITSDVAKSLGMISEIKEIKEIKTENIEPFDYKIAAKWYANSREKELLIKSEKMANEKIEDKVSGLEKALGTLTAAFDKLKGKVKALSINTDEGDTLEITGDVLEVGVEVTNQTEGTFTLDYNDKKYTVVVVANKVTELTEIVEDDEDDADMEALKVENEDLKKQVADLTASAEKHTELEAKYVAIEKTVKGLEGITSEYKKEDGSYEFKAEVKKEEAPKTAKDEILAHAEAKMEARKNKK